MSYIVQWKAVWFTDANIGEEESAVLARLVGHMVHSLMIKVEG